MEKKHTGVTSETKVMRFNYEEVEKIIRDLLGSECDGFRITDIRCDIPIDFLEIILEKSEGFVK